MLTSRVSHWDGYYKTSYFQHVDVDKRHVEKWEFTG